MSVMRVRKKVNPYTQIYNAVFEDRSLSYAALGLLSYLISKPENWEVKMKNLERQKVGRTAVRNAIQELIEAGYITRRRCRDDATGMMTGWLYDVFEEPQKDVRPPTDRKPSVGGPTVGERPPNNKEGSNKDQNNKEENPKGPLKKGFPAISSSPGNRSNNSPGSFGTTGRKGWLELAREDPGAFEFSKILPDTNTPVEAAGVARMYLKRRQTLLNDRDVWVMAYGFPHARFDGQLIPDWRKAETFAELLKPRLLTEAIKVARKAVQEEHEVLCGLVSAAEDTGAGMHRVAFLTKTLLQEGLSQETVDRAAFSDPVSHCYICKEHGLDPSFIQGKYKERIFECLTVEPFWNQLVTDQIEEVFGCKLHDVETAQAEYLEPIKAEKSKLQKLL